MVRVSGFLVCLFVCAVLFTPGARAQKVSTTADSNYSFTEHKRYAWREYRLQTRQNPDTNQVMDAKIVNSVNRMMLSKGFVEAKENPDFYLHYNTGGQANIGAGGTDP